MNLEIYSRQGESNKTVAIFIHGLGASNAWKIWVDRLLRDKRLVGVDVGLFTYDTGHVYIPSSIIHDTFKTPRFFNKVLKIPQVTLHIGEVYSVSELAQGLKDRLSIENHQYKHIVLVAHSMGGLVGISYLFNMVKHNLDHKVIGYISIATPFNGADLADLADAYLPGQKQVTDLNTNSKFIDTVNRAWFEYKGHQGKSKVEFFFAFAEQDEYVKRASSIPYVIADRWLATGLPGRHGEVIEFNRQTLTYDFICNNILESLNLFEKTLTKSPMFDWNLKKWTSGFVGRDWLFQEFVEWLNSETTSKIFIVAGDSGVGKSALLANIINRYSDMVAGFHFCQSTWRDTLDPVKFIDSMAQQLFQEKLTIETVEQADPTTLFHRHIVDPLRKQKTDKLKLVVVDALDEALLFDNISNIVRLLADNQQDVLQHVRLVLSCRNVSDVLDRFPLYKDKAHVIDANRMENRQDLRKYLEKKLSEPAMVEMQKKACVNTQRFFDCILKKSEGNFLYVTMVVEGILAGSHNLETPDVFPQGLKGKYLHFFERAYERNLDYYRENIRPVLDIICAAREPLTPEQIAIFLDKRPFDINPVLIKIKEYFPIQNQCVVPFHKSIIDWLTCEVGNAVFMVDLQRGHDSIARHIMENYRQSKLDLFTLKYLLTHLVEAKLINDVEEVLTDLGFIEAKCTKQMVGELIYDYLQALKMDGLPKCKKSVLEDFSRFVRHDAHVFMRYPFLVFQQAINQPDGSYVKQVAEKWKIPPKRPWLRLLNQSKRLESDWLMTFVDHIAGITSCAYSPDGKRIVSGSDDATLKVWDAETGQHIKTLAGHTARITSCAYSPDGKRIVSGSDDATLMVWDAKTGQYIKTLAGHTEGVRACAYSLDGKRIVSGAYDATLKVWDAETGQHIKTLAGHTEGVRACAYSPDGKRIVSCSYNAMMKVWNTETGREIRLKDDIWAMFCAYSPDGKRIVSGPGNKKMTVWDAETGQHIKTLAGHTEGVRACAYSPDGKRIVSGSDDKTLKVWDVKTGQHIKTLAGHTEKVMACAYSPDGKRIVSGSDDKTLKVWDAENGQEGRGPMEHASLVRFCAYSPDGKRIVSGSDDKTLKVWDAKTGQHISTLTGHTASIKSCAYSPDSKRIVSGSDDATLKVWNAETGRKIRDWTAHDGGVSFCAYSPDGKLIMSGSYGTKLKVWDAETGQKIRDWTAHAAGVRACAYSPDGKRIVSGSYDATLKIWNVETGQHISTLTGHTEGVGACAYSPDGKRIVSGSDDKTLKVWDAKTGQHISTLTGHTEGVRACAYSPDGKRIVSRSDDATLKVWDVETEKVIKEYQIDNVFTAEAWDGHENIALGRENGRVNIYELVSGSPDSLRMQR